jgi:uncharacterized phage protein (TIGR01671 family)
MDRYLFRGKRKYDNEWIVGHLFILNDKTFISVDSGCYYGRTHLIEDSFEEVILKTVGQCSGESDCDDKLIFEGDICEIWMGRDKQKSPYIVEDLRDLYLDLNHADSYNRISKIKVIGNIHNKE